MKKPEIAIVMPVYKNEFFEEAFQSVINQTDSNFHVYIGNDGGDRKIEKILHSFGELQNVTYRYFDENLGRTSLTAHWNRCLDMVGEENWVWLFSDDDVMDEDCIENFRKTQATNPDISLFRFNSIKFTNDILLRENTFPPKLSLSEFLPIKFNYLQESYAIEYIFHKSLLKEIGAFPDFPLGWCADDLFWIQCMKYSDIVTIPDSLVYWRYSDLNISGKRNTTETAIQKMNACILFTEELYRIGIFNDNDNLKRDFYNWLTDQFSYLRKSLSK